MATRTNWKTIYSDLPTHIAEALRTARLKPEQVIAKTDGELMAIEGIKEEDVNTIRAIYNADSITVATPAEVKVEAAKAEAEEKAEKVAKVIVARKRSNKYKTMAKKVKHNELYSVKEAVEILAKLAKSTKQNRRTPPQHP